MFVINLAHVQPTMFCLTSRPCIVLNPIVPGLMQSTVMPVQQSPRVVSCNPDSSMGHSPRSEWWGQLHGSGGSSSKARCWPSRTTRPHVHAAFQVGQQTWVQDHHWNCTRAGAARFCNTPDVRLAWCCGCRGASQVALRTSRLGDYRPQSQGVSNMALHDSAAQNGILGHCMP